MAFGESKLAANCEKYGALGENLSKNFQIYGIFRSKHDIGHSVRAKCQKIWGHWVKLVAGMKKYGVFG